MRGNGACLIALLSLGLAAGIPRALYAQDEAATAAYFRAIGGHFGVPSSEVAILAEGRGSPEQAAVVLYLSRRAGVSPSALLALRRRTRTWAEVADRYGMGAAAFHVRIPDGVELGALSQTYQRYRATPPTGWSEIRLGDAEVVALVNVRFLSDFLGVRPQQVVEAHRRTGSFVLAYRDLLSSPR